MHARDEPASGLAADDNRACDAGTAWAAGLIDAAAVAGEDADAAVKLATAYGGQLALPGGGDTASRWLVLAELARVNLTVARVFEAHTDALAILAEAGQPSAAGLSWGVFAAEHPDTRLDAAVDSNGAITLTGTKPWCSLGGSLDAALVTAQLPDDRRQLFRVDLRQSSVRAEAPERWVARGLRTVTSGPVHFLATAAEPVGEPGWYLVRPGFAWGGIGVAACWHGGALGLADSVRRHAARASTVPSHRGVLDALHLGIIDVALHASAASLEHATRLIDGVDGHCDPALLALRTRSVVAGSVERVLHQAAHALGPAPLAFDSDYAARVADLQLYVRQHHGERDLVELGVLVAHGRNEASDDQPVGPSPS